MEWFRRQKNKVSKFVNKVGNLGSKFVSKVGDVASNVGNVAKNVGDNIGTIGGAAANILLPEGKRRSFAENIKKGAEMTKRVLGEDSKISKYLQQASDIMDIKPPETALAYYQPPQGYYNRNIGGTNFQRYRPSRQNLGKRIKVSKFAKKKKSKF